MLGLSADPRDPTLQKCYQQALRNSKILVRDTFMDTAEGITELINSLKMVTGKGEGHTLVRMHFEG